MNNKLTYERLLNSSKLDLSRHPLLPLALQELVTVKQTTLEIDSLKSQHQIRTYERFQNVSFDDLIHLRKKVISQKMTDHEIVYAEKLLRFLEIRMGSLRTRVRKRHWKKKEQIDYFAQLISLLVEFYHFNKDIRYLNTSLKLLDLRWLRPTSFANFEIATILYERNLLITEKKLNELISK